MKSIAVTDIAGMRIGQVEDAEAGTGATVIICPQGMAAGLDVRGGGPASRDSRILDPLAAAETVHAVLLAGGSAFGLDAAGGVQRYLEERGIGLDVGGLHVPLVCQSDIFDFFVGTDARRPDAQMGYDACVAAEQGNYRDGNYGAGCGATVGKTAGPQLCTKSGIGSYAVEAAGLQVGCIVVVNAIGDVVDPQSGVKLAGVRGMSAQDALVQTFEAQADATAQGAVTNTTIGAIVTNAALGKAQLCKVASMAHDGMARAISPVHTSMDGDSVYALSVGSVEASVDIVGTLAAHVMERAIVNAVLAAESAYGLPCASDAEGAAS